MVAAESSSPLFSEEEKVLLPLTRASGLPGKYLHDEAIYHQERERIFYRSWLCIGRADDLPGVGSFMVRDIGEESVIVVRGNDGGITAFYNVCRHRGSKLLEEGSGKVASIQCPYHSWTYSLGGTLIGAPHTDGLPDFDRNAYSLTAIRCETWAGFVFVNLDDQARPLREHLKGLVEKCTNLPLDTLKRGGRIEYDVAANWKIICENYSECYHCPTIHPELNRITYYRTSFNYAFLTDKETKGAFSGGWMGLSEGMDSMTWTGKTKRPPIKGTAKEDMRRIYYFLIFPNMFFSLHPDYLLVHTVQPQGVTHSKVICEFYFEPETMARPDFDQSDATKVWDVINRQDWHVCELSQKGVRSRAYVPGRYTNLEGTVHDFDAYILQVMRAE
jgi:Rieske 2Fe-2S family protein